MCGIVFPYTMSRILHYSNASAHAIVIYVELCCDDDCFALIQTSYFQAIAIVGNLVMRLSRLSVWFIIGFPNRVP